MCRVQVSGSNTLGAAEVTSAMQWKIFHCRSTSSSTHGCSNIGERELSASIVWLRRTREVRERAFSLPKMKIRISRHGYTQLVCYIVERGKSFSCHFLREVRTLDVLQRSCSQYKVRIKCRKRAFSLRHDILFLTRTHSDSVYDRNDSCTFTLCTQFLSDDL